MIKLNLCVLDLKKLYKVVQIFFFCGFQWTNNILPVEDMDELSFEEIKLILS